MYTDKQLKSSGSIQQAKCNKQNVKKELLLECCQRNKPEENTFPARTKLQSISKASEGNLLQLVFLSKQQELSSNLTNKSSHENVSSNQRESLEELCLGFDSVGFRKEDEDSASDLSDSERTLSNTPPSFTPTKLNLRPEDIKPGYFKLQEEYKCNHYSYPDFLPTPYNSWNLKDVSVFVNKEKQHTLQSTASGVLEKYVERLLQLEWLQMQTIQSEKAKPPKLRPQTAPNMSRNGKTPATCTYSPVRTKQIHHASNMSNIPRQDINNHRKYLYPESSSVTYARNSCPKVLVTKKIPVSALTPNQDKKILLQAQHIYEYNSKMQSTGNIRHQKQSSVSSHAGTFKELKQTKFHMLKKAEGDQKPGCSQKCNSRLKYSSNHNEISLHKRKPK